MDTQVIAAAKRKRSTGFISEAPCLAKKRSKYAEYKGLIEPLLELQSEEELVVDLFAGGGGASTGIERALKRSVDIAINHDPVAISVHKINHPSTRHYISDIFEVDPIEATEGLPVGLLWASPACTHFSKARGSKPKSKQMRAMAWVVIKWAEKKRPRVILLENVEEFQDWGPLGEDGQPDLSRKGETFLEWVACLRNLGYKVDWKELRASDLGITTIRKRLFVVARCDGDAILWPETTHGDPKKKDFQSKGLLPHRPAADIIDWSLDCPSIFERKKPLADNTLRRIAKGIARYVIEANEPFIVNFRYSSVGSSIQAPLPTITAGSFVKRPGGNGHAMGLCVPVISTYYGHKSAEGDARGATLDEPLRTQTTENRHALLSAFLEKKGENDAILSPFITEHANSSNQRNMSLEDPLRTTCANVKGGHFAMVAPTLIQTGYGERKGQSPRVPGLENPLGTIVAGAAKHALVCASMEPVEKIRFACNCGHVGYISNMDEPCEACGGKESGYVTYVDPNNEVSGHSDVGEDDPDPEKSAGDHHSMVAALMTKHYGGVIGTSLHDPVGTVTTSDHHSLTVANLIHAGHGERCATGAKRWSDGTSDLKAPLNTITASGSPGALISSHVVKLRGTNIGHSMDTPLHTITAGGTHVGEVRALLVKYGAGDYLADDGTDAVLVKIKGETYVIADIGMRMLQPHELFRANDFPAEYVIDKGAFGNPVTKTDQVRLCGNSVPPGMAEKLVSCNFTPRRIEKRKAA